MKNKEIAIDIGQRFIDIRKQRRLPQKEMAEDLNIAASYLCEIENGRAKPNIELLIKMTDIYNVNLNYLVMGTGAMYIDTGPKMEPKGVDIYDGIDSIEELLWLMENSKFFNSMILLLANKALITDGELIKKSLQKSPTDEPKQATKK